MDRDDNYYCLRNKRYLRFCLLAVGIFLTACAAGRITEGAYINEAKGFTVQLPPKAWSVETGEEADLVLRHKYRQAGMAIHATCGEIPADRPLEIVSRHLFFGIKRKEIVWQERHAASEEEAMEVVLRGELGGRELLVHGYTLKGPGCVYDLVLFAPPEDYLDVNGEFETLVGRFHLLKGEKQ